MINKRCLNIMFKFFLLSLDIVIYLFSSFSRLYIPKFQYSVTSIHLRFTLNDFNIYIETNNHHSTIIISLKRIMCRYIDLYFTWEFCYKNDDDRCTKQLFADIKDFQFSLILCVKSQFHKNIILGRYEFFLIAVNPNFLEDTPLTYLVFICLNINFVYM